MHKYLYINVLKNHNFLPKYIARERNLRKKYEFVGRKASSFRHNYVSL